MDYKFEAEKILCEHTSAVMSAARCGFEDNQSMLEFTTEECGFILTQHLLEGKYTPLQYNAIRNELASLLWSIFGPHIEAEKTTEFVKMFSI